jgi:CubicO group peptidase (beta-lactamase class C family)
MALVRAHRLLAASGYGILIHDAYRPWYVTRMFWDVTPPDKKIFVADPADGSRHNRGAAADVTLYELATGRPVEMVSTYDETSDRAFPDYPGGTSLQRWHRDLLRRAMEAQGFSVYDAEWWHFDYKDWREYPIINLRFEQVDSVNAAAPRDSASAIDRVTRALRPPVEVVGRPPVRWTLADRMAHYHVPGVSIALIDSGRIAWARGFGVKKAGTADSIGGATIFQAGSTSKPIAVTAMLRLVEQGRLSLDENVNRYLRSWKLPENRFTAREKVTLRRIVSHSAGLTVHGFPGYAVGQPLPTLPQILDGKKPANTEPVRVDTFPGALYRYSGGGLTIMQQLLIDVTGKSFPELTRDLVLGPTGMTHSTYEEPLPSARVADAARAHDSQGVMIPGGWHIYPEMAAAGLWTTPSDLARWALAITAARAGRASTPLSPGTVTQMLTVQKEPLGLGVFLGGNGRAFHFGHGGDNQGFHTDLVMYPEAGQGVAVMANGDAGPALIQEIINAVSDEYQWPERRLTRVTPAALDSSEIASVVGAYTIKASEPVQVRVRRGGAQLVLDVSPYFPPAELVPESPTSFVAVELGWHVRAVRAGAGRVSALAIELDPTDTVSATRSDSASADR